MGSRFSASQPTIPSCSHSTVKVITPGGQLREYAGTQITASLAVLDTTTKSSSDPAPSFFLCDADALFFDEPIPPMSPDEGLLPGRLYFVLQEDMSRQTLSGADMRALALRATAALQADGKAKRPRGKDKNSRRGNCTRVTPVQQLGDTGVDDDVPSLVDSNAAAPEKHRTAPDSSQRLKIHRPPASIHRRGGGGGPVGNKRRQLGRRVPLGAGLGTIHEDPAE